MIANTTQHGASGLYVEKKLLKIVTTAFKKIFWHQSEFHQNFGLEPEKLTKKLYDLIEELMLYATVCK
jgi:hypothetical protein